MYQYIMVFQIICILLTGGFLYVLCESEALKNKKYRASLIGTMIGFFLMQSGYLNFQITVYFIQHFCMKAY